MKRSIESVLFVSALVLVGCGGGTTPGGDGGTTDGPATSNATGPVKLVDNATVAAVSGDQKVLAYYTPGTAMAAPGLPMGALSVAPLPISAGAMLDDGAFGAFFGRSGNTLLYFTTPTPSTEKGSTQLYGAMHIWTPKMSSAFKLTQFLTGNFAVPPDGSFVIFWDIPSPTQAAMGKVILVRAADCSAAACTATQLTTSDVSVAAMTTSPDGKYAAFQVKAGTGIQAAVQTFLVSVADGKAMQVASTSTVTLPTAPMAFSPDGKLLATANAPTMFAVLQLQMINTATFMPDTSWTSPAGGAAVEFGFSDAQTLLLHNFAIKGFTPADDGIYKITAGGGLLQVIPAAATFTTSYVPDGAGRYLFASTKQAMGGVHDAVVYDLLSAQMPAAVPLATAIAGFPTISGDLAYVEFLETYDATKKSGTLTVATLPDGTKTTIASGISIEQAGFAEGTSTLLYVDAPDATTGAGTLKKWSAGTSKDIAQNVLSVRERAAPDTIYFSVSAADSSVTPARAPGIYSVPLQ